MTKKTITYPAIFKKDSPEGYTIEFPDIQSAYSGVNTNNIDFGIEIAQGVLRMVAKDYLDKGDKLPKATPLNEIQIERDSFIKLVSISIEG
ncbi:type II toxin-antitoxin system HicB family antitoxin [Enterococcus gallinarum]|uniref:type II toxin-antitoxin system HicB family antitoxin n=1 Tax=Enterococcus gallinarum TaxID=1353 RepID=UPI001D17782B|nr:type II toxin-antitoxin system HicB family antitoxin [Enterococcus gallinarum]MCC4043732.1 type II toxin-antitoxin system HicB family antitoxin [Enterococcus gallinarum]